MSVHPEHGKDCKPASQVQKARACPDPIYARYHAAEYKAKKGTPWLFNCPIRNPYNRQLSPSPLEGLS